MQFGIKRVKPNKIHLKGQDRLKKFVKRMRIVILFFRFILFKQQLNLSIKINNLVNFKLLKYLRLDKIQNNKVLYHNQQEKVCNHNLLHNKRKKAPKNKDQKVNM